MRRAVRYFDPGNEGFVERMLRLGGCAVLVGSLLLLCVASLFLRTQYGRHFVVFALIEAGLEDEAAPRAAALVRDYPTARWEYYRLKGENLRHLGRVDESLQTYRDAIAAMPDEWWPHSHLCFYTALLTGDPSGVMDSCDRSIELGPSWPDVAYDRRAIARALTGDLEGAASDLEVAMEHLDANDWRGYTADQRQARQRWLEKLREGENPIDEEELRAERSYY